MAIKSCAYILTLSHIILDRFERMIVYRYGSIPIKKFGNAFLSFEFRARKWQNCAQMNMYEYSQTSILQILLLCQLYILLHFLLG